MQSGCLLLHLLLEFTRFWASLGATYPPCGLFIKVELYRVLSPLRPLGSTVFGEPLVECGGTYAAALVKDFLEWYFLVFPTLDDVGEACGRLYCGSAEVLSPRSRGGYALCLPLKQVSALKFRYRAEYGQHEFTCWRGRVDVFFQAHKFNAFYGELLHEFK